MKAFVFVLAFVLGGCCHRHPELEPIKKDKNGCYSPDGCNSCCPAPGGGYSCTLMACIDCKDPANKELCKWQQ